MRAVPWMTCWWPGLTPLWRRGHLGGLGLATAFGLLAQFALVRTFAPAEMPGLLVLAATPPVAWSCVVGLWIAGVWLAWRETSLPAAALDPQIDQWFSEAQTEYLRGHWIEAEELLARLLSRRPDDVEARLLLASVQRRTRRLEAARQTLDELANRPQAARWAFEIRSEEQRIVDSQQEGDTGENEEGPQTSKAA